MRWVIYVDMDAFYLSCELTRHEDLRGKPAMVAHDPKEGKGRGVVLSASYEARALGFRSAMPVKEAWRMRDKAAWLPPDFGFYEETSRKVLAALRERSDLVRAFSIDEAAYPHEAAVREEALAEGREVQRVLREKLALPASVGVATDLSVAKIASDRAKPGGVVVVAPDDIAGFLGPLPVKTLPGIGPVTSEALQAIGVREIRDLTTTPLSRLRKAIGPVAGSYVALAKGVPPAQPWPDESSPRSMGTMVTFDEDMTEEHALVGQVSNLGKTLLETLKQSQNLCRGVTVQVRWEDMTRVQRSRSFLYPTDDPGTINSVSRALLHQLLGERERPGKGVRTLGLTLDDLRPADRNQRTLDFP